jgi:hypothetical protein
MFFSKVVRSRCPSFLSNSSKMYNQCDFDMVKLVLLFLLSNVKLLVKSFLNESRFHKSITFHFNMWWCQTTYSTLFMSSWAQKEQPVTCSCMLKSMSKTQWFVVTSNSISAFQRCIYLVEVWATYMLKMVVNSSSKVEA